MNIYRITANLDCLRVAGFSLCVCVCVLTKSQCWDETSIFNTDKTHLFKFKECRCSVGLRGRTPNSILAMDHCLAVDATVDLPCFLWNIYLGSWRPDLEFVVKKLNLITPHPQTPILWDNEKKCVAWISQLPTSGQRITHHNHDKHFNPHPLSGHGLTAELYMRAT